MFANIIPFLILFPLAIAAILAFVSEDKVRSALVKVSAAIIAAGSLWLLLGGFGHVAGYFSADSEIISKIILVLEFLVSGYLLYISFKSRKPIAIFLVLAQLAAVVYLEFLSGQAVVAENNLFFDKFSVIMALIIGIIGGLISIFSLGYMKEFHQHHPEVVDRSKLYFVTVFVFLSAMFGIIFSNNLLWMYFFWEITTLCSFLLIGYTRTKEAIANAFLALKINLFGGLCFIIGIIILVKTSQIVEVDKLLSLSKSLVLLPVVLISLAGMTKSAQMPFSNWLLGAMVAPTPVSALLHSSTMVKAGVYVILRFAAVFQDTRAGLMVALIGGLTFLIASLIAISQNNAKRVLAYSTVANLGLVVLCAGIGTYEAVWAGILLIIFHAISKALLFLCVGVVEQKIGSRDIEDMSGLIVSMPKVAAMMLIGMAGMFLAPFGMLISKWAVLKALVDANPVLAALVVFGSSATLFFWVKWMGKLIMVINPRIGLEEGMEKKQFFVLAVLSGMTVGMCLLWPLVSGALIEPYVITIYGKTMTMDRGNLIIMFIMLGLVALFPLSFINYGKRVKVVDPYLGGANASSHTTFKDSFGNSRILEMKNYYMPGYFGEKRMLFLAAALSAACIVGMLSFALIR